MDERNQSRKSANSWIKTEKKNHKFNTPESSGSEVGDSPMVGGVAQFRVQTSGD